MTLLSRSLVTFASVAGAVCLVMLFRGTTETGQQVRIAPKSTPLPLESEAPAVPAPIEAGPAPAAVAEAEDENVPAPAALELATVTLAWERQLESAADLAPKSDTNKARAIFALLPTLPEEALGEATERAVDRLPDADYANVALRVVIDPKTHGRVMSVLFADLMQRPNAITLPALLRIAQNLDHGFAPSARENLALLLGANFGTDWSLWEAEVQRVLSPFPR